MGNVAPAWVIGGGPLGAAIARLLAAQDRPVVVASRTARPHAGLWRHLELSAPNPVPAEAEVWIAAGPHGSLSGEALWGELLPRWLKGRSFAKLTLCGPAGQGEPNVDAFMRLAASLPMPANIIRFSWIFSNDDALFGAMLSRIRARQTLIVPRNLPPLWPLWVEDAARAALSLSGAHTLRGPAAVRVEDVAQKLAGKSGGRWRYAWWPTRLPPFAALPADDGWPEPQLGSRTSLEMWLERLPFPRSRG